MNSAQTLSFDPIGPDEFEKIGRAFKDELQRRALSRKSDEAEALAAKLINASPITNPERRERDKRASSRLSA
ncbi:MULTISPECIES: hypothetical protein [Sinorhizobium]|uniref:Uncharacterized protein n=1 Tax=Sinorhizobium americanum TaxID=194963 RepID=A0A2S3YTR9_9HYPH|nr:MULTISPECIES: hypothetical protein [Sinorhizobium]POH34995.1 hypothetical protein ATY31_04360 [Sinorhizobium americanum]